MGTHPIFESDFDCLTEKKKAMAAKEEALLEELMELEDKVAKKRATKPEELKTEWIKKQRTLVEEDAHALIQDSVKNVESELVYEAEKISEVEQKLKPVQRIREAKVTDTDVQLAKKIRAENESNPEFVRVMRAKMEMPPHWETLFRTLEQQTRDRTARALIN